MENANVEESKFDLSNVSMDYSLKENSLSKIFNDNTPEVLGSLIDKGNRYYKKFFGNTQLKKQLAFLQLVRHLSYIFDPWREESLTQVCLRSCQVWHRIPLEFILTKPSISLIMHNQQSSLSDMFHNLSADSNSQKEALRKNEILVNSFELLALVLLKHINTLPSCDSFYQLVQD